MSAVQALDSPEPSLQGCLLRRQPCMPLRSKIVRTVSELVTHGSGAGSISGTLASELESNITKLSLKQFKMSDLRLSGTLPHVFGSVTTALADFSLQVPLGFATVIACIGSLYWKLILKPVCVKRATCECLVRSQAHSDRSQVSSPGCCSMIVFQGNPDLAIHSVSMR